MARISLRHFFVIVFLTTLIFALNMPIARAAGVVNPCDEASLDTALAGGGTITFGCSGTITITTTKTITTNTIIDGSGQSVTISGGGTVRVFTVNAGVSLEIRNLRISDGSAGVTGGAGIFNDGTLTIINSTFSSNTATGGVGGALFNSGTLTISNSTFFSNSADNGGAISNGGTVAITNSTFSGNTSNAGGAIINGGAMTVTNATFYSNSAPTADNFYIGTLGTFNISASIVYLGTCLGTIVDGGNNIAFSAAGCVGANVDPLFGAMGNYGGATLTFPLLAGSPAFDAFTAGCPATDQRGVTRPQGAACDIGAYEANVTLSPIGVPIIVVPTQSAPEQCQDMLDPTFAAPVGWYCQVLMHDNTWTGYAGTIPAELTDAGVIIAVDVIYYDFPGHAAQQVDGTHQVCLQGEGRFIFLSNDQAPRQIVELNSVYEGGYTCAWVTTPGTAVLING